MDKALPRVPNYLEKAMQGLAFWIGHRQSLFHGYPLSEGALVAEACNLIQANKPDHLIILPECMYKNLIMDRKDNKKLGKLSRADLIICDKAAKDIGRYKNISGHIRFVIEIKRGSAPKKQIDLDLIRLRRYLDCTQNDVRALLIVVFEKGHPKRFAKEGKSMPGKQEMPDKNGFYRVRRTVKAATSFSGHNTAHYICMIEVFRDNS